jgi:ribonuclease E
LTEPDDTTSNQAPGGEPDTPVDTSGSTALEAPAARPRRRRAASRPPGAVTASTAAAPAPEPSAAEPPAPEPQAAADGPAMTDEASGTERATAETDLPGADLPEGELVPDGELLPEAESTDDEVEAAEPAEPVEQPASRPSRRAARRPAAAPPTVMFQAPDLSDLPPRPAPATAPDDDDDEEAGSEPASSTGPADSGDGDDGEGRSRRRRRGRRGRGRPRDEDENAPDDAPAEATETKKRSEPAQSDSTDGGKDEQKASSDDDDESGDGSGSKRRRRRRRRGGDGDSADSSSSSGSSGSSGSSSSSDGGGSAEDEIKGVTGSTRLEAKRQRRRDSRDQSRRRAPIVTEAEYLARREAVDRVMIVRNAGDRTQIAVLEDNVLVEHYVTRASSTSYAGNVYLGKVQNVLPSMEAAFVDIGKGRNGVLYAGEVNYDASGLEGKPRKIEQALKSGQSVVVQVTKDPIGHKGARLTSQISLPGRYMVYVPEGGSAGISRKLPDTERARLRSILKKITPEDAGVIVRTAAEGASEEELTRDISRLATQWEQIQKKAGKAQAPALLSAEPDLVVRVVRDIFNEDFRELVVQGESEWDTIQNYVAQVAPDLTQRLRKHIDSEDVFDTYRIDEQLLKALDRKVYLPSGGSLVFDRTEAMTVVDVNTGKFTGKGGNLEETVTRNNLEAAEELVRQLRLRDIGGIIVTDFIDMVLESNRELVLRRLTECLGRDRTKHQVAEVTSLGLVQMTRKRVGQGLLEAYSEPCPHCGGKGVHIELPSAGGTPKSGGKPIPRPPTTRPIPLPPEPAKGERKPEPVDEAGVDEVGADVAAPDVPASDDVALEGAVEGSVESTEDLSGGTRPTGDEVEVEAASAETPTDPDVEADAPAVRQAAAAEAGAELPAPDQASPRPRRSSRRRAGRSAPTTAVVEAPVDVPANGESAPSGSPTEAVSSEAAPNGSPTDSSPVSEGSASEPSTDARPAVQPDASQPGQESDAAGPDPS